MSRAACESMQSHGDPEGTRSSAFGLPLPTLAQGEERIVAVLPAKACQFLEKGLAFTGGTRITITQAPLDYTHVLVWGSAAG